MIDEIKLLDHDGTSLAVIYNRRGEVSHVSQCTYNETIDGPDMCNIQYDARVLPNVLPERLIAQIRMSSGKYRTYVSRTPLSNPGEPLARFSGHRIWIDLLDRYTYPRHVSFSNISLNTFAQAILSGAGADHAFEVQAPANATLGYIDINIYTPPLQILRDVAEKTGHHLTFREQSATDKTLVFTPIDYRLISGAITSPEMSSVARRDDRRERITRIYAVGGGDPPLTLEDSAHGQAYIDAPSYTPDNHIIGVYKNTDLVDWKNLIESPALSGDYQGGLCEGWQKIGAAVLSQNTDGRYIHYGHASQKIVTSGDSPQGVSQCYMGTLDASIRWSNIFIESMAAGSQIRVEVRDGKRSAHNIISHADYSPGNEHTITRLGILFSETMQEYRIYGVGDTTFYFDAALVAPGLEFFGFVEGDMADVLYDEALAYLLSREHAGLSYTITTVTDTPHEVSEWLRITPPDEGERDLKVVQVTGDLLAGTVTYEVGGIERAKSQGQIIQKLSKESDRALLAQRKAHRASKTAASPQVPRIHFFSGEPASPSPKDRASVIGGEALTGQGDTYNIPAFLGPIVGRGQSFYLYIHEQASEIQQTENPEIASSHMPLYNVVTPPQTSNDPTIYNQLFVTSDLFTLTSPLLMLSKTHNSITATWTNVVGATAYVLQYRQSGSQNWITPADQTSPVTVGRLPLDTTYIFQVKSTAPGFNDSEWDQESATTNGQLGTPSLSVFRRFQTRLEINITRSTTPNIVPQQYDLQIREQSNANFGDTTTLTGQDFIRFTDLTPATDYVIRAKAKHAGYLDSEWSELLQTSTV
ncbi:MAG: fibronectin type III domain-containing protein [Gemmatimonadetes bacterium]|nr:fibronectin type III domain-containing protein [Gemmatimonadota bacterium]MYF80026.1 fibronectin type III domain-containing protein [Chloroflexota bacterium]